MKRAKTAKVAKKVVKAKKRAATKKVKATTRNSAKVKTARAKAPKGRVAAKAKSKQSKTRVETRAVSKPKPAAKRASTTRGATRGAARVETAKLRTRTKRALGLPLVVSPPTIEQPMVVRHHASAAALRAFEQAVKVFNRRQMAEAKAMFENIQTRFPAEVEIIARSQTYIQVCHQKLGQSQALPGNAEELYDRGVFALNIGDFTQARTFFEKALRLRPDEPYLLYSLAATHAQTGSLEQALDYLRRSIQIQPRFRAQALNDADFSGLRDNKRFLELLGLTSPFDRLESRR
ncbi:MAG TPA: tetratricopeptide repeat protein [Blastocatellia bacterium]|nr:tetratricopeptide repeat protein [Blastocatellia bacterium]